MSVPMTPQMASLMLTLLLSLQPVTTDLMLTALPSLAADLHATMAPVQFTLSATILAFGIAQLAWGPVADRFGRRPVMLLGLAGYALATLGALFAPSVVALVCWRAAQGATMAASVVCARAMLRDLYEPHEGAGVMARALTGLGVVAILCPSLGGLVVAAFGWRAAIATMFCFAVGLSALVLLRLPETIRARDPHAITLAPMLRQVAGILRHPAFRAWTLLVSCTYGGLYVTLASSGIVMIQVLHLSTAAAGAVISLMGVSYIGGTLLCRHWLPRHGLTGTVARAAWCSLTGGLLLAAVAWADTRSVPLLMLPICIFAVGHGVHQPCGQAGAVSAFPHAAGLASALAGFALALVAFGVGLWLGQALDGSVRPLALGVSVGSCLSALAAWTVVRRHGEPPAPAAVPRTVEATA